LKLINTQKLATELAQKHNLKAYKYDLYLREFDNMVELVGLVNDPTLDMGDFDSREMLFPKKWVTLKTFFAEERVAV
jgi:hypothetical protein